MHEDTDQHHHDEPTHVVTLAHHEPTHDTLSFVARNRPSVLGQRGALLMPRRLSGGAFDFHGNQHVVGAPAGATNMAGKRKDRYAAMMDENHDDDDDDHDDDDENDDDDGNDNDNDVNNNDSGVTATVVVDTRVSGELTQQLKRFRFASTTFSITVRTLTGKQLLLSVHSSDTVDDLKARIEELEGIPVAQQRLVFGGRVLPDVDSLQTHNITDEGAELHLVLALRGGVCCASPHCLCVANVAIDDFFSSLPRRSHK